MYCRNMARSIAERQRRYRERRKGQQPVMQYRYRQLQDRRSRPQRWADAVATLRVLQEEYQDWSDNLPENLQSTALAEKLEAVCEVDVDQLDIDLPLGFGRD